MSVDIQVAPYIVHGVYYPLWAKSLWIQCETDAVSREIFMDALFQYAHEHMSLDGSIDSDLDIWDNEAQIIRHSLKNVLRNKIYSYIENYKEDIYTAEKFQSASLYLQFMQSFFGDLVLDDLGLIDYMPISCEDSSCMAWCTPSEEDIQQNISDSVADGVYDSVQSLSAIGLSDSTYYQNVINALLKLSTSADYLPIFFKNMYILNSNHQMGYEDSETNDSHEIIADKENDDKTASDDAALNFLRGLEDAQPDFIPEIDGYVSSAVQVFNYEDMVSTLSAMKWDPEIEAYTKSIRKKVDKSCGYKAGYILRDTAKVDRISETLTKNFPHFQEVIDLIRRQLILSVVTKTPVHIPPILLLGLPGIGKTTFMYKMSDSMGLFNRIIHMETLTGGMVLAGSSTHWKGGHAGVFFDTMMDSDVCNPIIMLDELDKVSMDTVQSPFAPLYSVLEPSTSADFKDEAIPCKLDMSRVNWMATANKPLDIIRNELGDALLSRFTVFNIPEPSVDEKRVIIQSMYARYIQDKNIQHIMEPTLNNDIIDTMLQGSLREAYKQIEDGCGNALAKVYKSLDKMNHKIHITYADTSTHTRHAQRLKVGFHR